MLNGIAAGQGLSPALQAVSAVPQVCGSRGRRPLVQINQDRLSTPAPPEGKAGARHVREEIAGLRSVLRTVFRLVGEVAHLAQVYGLGCTRLVRLLRAAGAGNSRLEAQLKEAIDIAIREAAKEMGLI